MGGENKICTGCTMETHRKYIKTGKIFNNLEKEEQTHNANKIGKNRSELGIYILTIHNPNYLPQVTEAQNTSKSVHCTSVPVKVRNILRTGH